MNPSNPPKRSQTFNSIHNSLRYLMNVYNRRNAYTSRPLAQRSNISPHKNVESTKHMQSGGVFNTSCALFESGLPSPPIAVFDHPEHYLSIHYYIPQEYVPQFHARGIKELYPWQVKCLLQWQGNLVYTAPTSGGKSLIAEILCCRAVAQGKRCLWLCPLRTLCEEKAKDMQLVMGSGVYCVHADRKREAVLAMTDACKIAVCTFEKAHALTNIIESPVESPIYSAAAQPHTFSSQPHTHLSNAAVITGFPTSHTRIPMGRWAVVVIDEAHMVADRHRGGALELFLAKMRYRQTRGDPCVLVAMSATLGPGLRELLGCTVGDDARKQGDSNGSAHQRGPHTRSGNSATLATSVETPYLGSDTARPQSLHTRVKLGALLLSPGPHPGADARVGAGAVGWAQSSLANRTGVAVPAHDTVTAVAAGDRVSARMHCSAHEAAAGSLKDEHGRDQDGCIMPGAHPPIELATTSPLAPPPWHIAALLSDSHLHTQHAQTSPRGHPSLSHAAAPLIFRQEAYRAADSSFAYHAHTWLFPWESPLTTFLLPSASPGPQCASTRVAEDETPHRAVRMCAQLLGASYTAEQGEGVRVALRTYVPGSGVDRNVGGVAMKHEESARSHYANTPFQRDAVSGASQSSLPSTPHAQSLSSPAQTPESLSSPPLFAPYAPAYPLSWSTVPAFAPSTATYLRACQPALLRELRAVATAVVRLMRAPGYVGSCTATDTFAPAQASPPQIFGDGDGAESAQTAQDVTDKGGAECLCRVLAEFECLSHTHAAALCVKDAHALLLLALQATNRHAIANSGNSVDADGNGGMYEENVSCNPCDVEATGDTTTYAHSCGGARDEDEWRRALAALTSAPIKHDDEDYVTNVAFEENDDTYRRGQQSHVDSAACAARAYCLARAEWLSSAPAPALTPPSTAAHGHANGHSDSSSSEREDPHAASTSAGGPARGVLVFCGTKRGSESTAAALGEAAAALASLAHLAQLTLAALYRILLNLSARQHSGPIPMFAHDYSVRIPHTAQQSPLARALQKAGRHLSPALHTSIRAGIFFHHAGLSVCEMTHVERALRTQQLFLVCCTATLAVGINLPVARTVVLMEEPLPSATLLTQMAGRAGRTGFGDGDCVFVLDAPQGPRWEHVKIATTTDRVEFSTPASPRPHMLSYLRFEPTRWMHAETLVLAKPHAPLASSLTHTETVLFRYVADLLYSGLARCVADVYLATQASLWALKRREWAWGVGRALISLIRCGFITVAAPSTASTTHAPDTPGSAAISPVNGAGYTADDREHLGHSSRDTLPLHTHNHLDTRPHDPLNLASHPWWCQPLPRAPQPLYCPYQWRVPAQPVWSVHGSQQREDAVALPLHPHLFLAPTPLLQACSMAGITPPEAVFVMRLAATARNQLRPDMLYFAFLAAPVAPVPVRWQYALPLLRAISQGSCFAAIPTALLHDVSTAFRLDLPRLLAMHPDRIAEYRVNVAAVIAGQLTDATAEVGSGDGHNEKRCGSHMDDALACAHPVPAASISQTIVLAQRLVLAVAAVALSRGMGEWLGEELGWDRGEVHKVSCALVQQLRGVSTLFMQLAAGDKHCGNTNADTVVPLLHAHCEDNELHKYSFYMGTDAPTDALGSPSTHALTTLALLIADAAACVHEAGAAAGSEVARAVAKAGGTMPRWVVPTLWQAGLTTPLLVAQLPLARVAAILFASRPAVYGLGDSTATSPRPQRRSKGTLPSQAVAEAAKTLPHRHTSVTQLGTAHATAGASTISAKEEDVPTQTVATSSARAHSIYVRRPRTTTAVPTAATLVTLPSDKAATSAHAVGSSNTASRKRKSGTLYCRARDGAMAAEHAIVDLWQRICTLCGLASRTRAGAAASSKFLDDGSCKRAPWADVAASGTGAHPDGEHAVWPLLVDSTGGRTTVARVYRQCLDLARQVRALCGTWVGITVEEESTQVTPNIVEACAVRLPDNPPQAMHEGMQGAGAQDTQQSLSVQPMGDHDALRQSTLQCESDTVVEAEGGIGDKRSPCVSMLDGEDATKDARAVVVDEHVRSAPDPLPAHLHAQEPALLATYTVQLVSALPQLERVVAGAGECDSAALYAMYNDECADQRRSPAHTPLLLALLLDTVIHLIPLAPPALTHAHPDTLTGPAVLSILADLLVPRWATLPLCNTTPLARPPAPTFADGGVWGSAGGPTGLVVWDSATAQLLVRACIASQQPPSTGIGKSHGSAGVPAERAVDSESGAMLPLSPPWPTIPRLDTPLPRLCVLQLLLRSLTTHVSPTITHAHTLVHARNNSQEIDSVLIDSHSHAPSATYSSAHSGQELQCGARAVHAHLLVSAAVHAQVRSCMRVDAGNRWGCSAKDTEATEESLVAADSWRALMCMSAKTMDTLFSGIQDSLSPVATYTHSPTLFHAVPGAADLANPSVTLLIAHTLTHAAMQVVMLAQAAARVCALAEGKVDVLDARAVGLLRLADAIRVTEADTPPPAPTRASGVDCTGAACKFVPDGTDGKLPSKDTRHAPAEGSESHSPLNVSTIPPHFSDRLLLRVRLPCLPLQVLARTTQEPCLLSAMTAARDTAAESEDDGAVGDIFARAVAQSLLSAATPLLPNDPLLLLDTITVGIDAVDRLDAHSTNLECMSRDTDTQDAIGQDTEDNSAEAVELLRGIREAGLVFTQGHASQQGCYDHDLLRLLPLCAPHTQTKMSMSRSRLLAAVNSCSAPSEVQELMRGAALLYAVACVCVQPTILKTQEEFLYGRGVTVGAWLCDAVAMALEGATPAEVAAVHGRGMGQLLAAYGNGDAQAWMHTEEETTKADALMLITQHTLSVSCGLVSLLRTCLPSATWVLGNVHRHSAAQVQQVAYVQPAYALALQHAQRERVCALMLHNHDTAVPHCVDDCAAIDVANSKISMATYATAHFADTHTPHSPLSLAQVRASLFADACPEPSACGSCFPVLSVSAWAQQCTWEAALACLHDVLAFIVATVPSALGARASLIGAGGPSVEELLGLLLAAPISASNCHSPPVQSGVDHIPSQNGDMILDIALDSHSLSVSTTGGPAQTQQLRSLRTALREAMGQEGWVVTVDAYASPTRGEGIAK